MAIIKGWKKVKTKYPLVSDMSSNDRYESGDQYIEISNIMMHTDTPYWVKSNYFTLKEFRTIKEARSFVTKYMQKNEKSYDPWKKFLSLDRDIQAEAIWDFVGDNNYYEDWDDFVASAFSKDVDPNTIPFSTWVQNNDYDLKIQFIKENQLKSNFLVHAKGYL